MSLEINPQYVDKLSRTVALTLHPSFVSKHPQVRSYNVFIHNFTTSGIVFSIIHNGEMTVFCCAVQISMPRQYGQTQIEITSETKMKYFTENLFSRLPSLIWLLDEQMMFDKDAQTGHLREIGNNLDVVLLNENLFMVMFDSTIYFFRINSKGDVFWFQLPLWELNQTTKDSDKRIPDLSRCFDSFRFYTELELHDNSVCFDLYSDVFNLGNSCVCAYVTIRFDDDDDTLERRVECSRKLISKGVDNSPFSSTTEPDFEETRFSDKRLKIRNEDSDEDSDEEDSDEDSDEDPVLVVKATDGTIRYVFQTLGDDNSFYCIILRNGIVHLLQVEQDDLCRLKSTDLDVLIGRFEINSVDLSERLEEFGEVDFSCRIEIEDPIQITCDFEDSVGVIVLTQQLVIENDKLREI